MKQNLIKCGNIGSYNPEPIVYEDTKMWMKAHDNNYKQLMALDKKAKKAKSLVGRVYQENVADGYAYYLITAESARTVTLRHVKGIGDDYMVRFIGEGGSVDKRKIVNMMEMHDELVALFSGKK